MTTFELNEFLDDLLLNLDTESNLMLSLRQYTATINNISSKLFSIFHNSAKNPAQEIADRKTEIAKAIGEMKEIKPSVIILELNRIKDKLYQVRALEPQQESNLPDDLISLISSFLDKYEKFISSYKASECLEVLFLGRELYNSIRILQDFLVKINHNLVADIESFDGNNELSLFIPAELNYSLFVKKLSAINIIYNETTQLLSVSTSDYPLKMSKVESGSLWVKIFGESKVIDFIINMMDRTINYIHRNYTLEGKIESFPRKVEKIESVLKLKKELEESGIDTSTMNDQLNKSSVIIAQQLTDLLEYQPIVKINKKLYSVGDEYTKKLLPYQKKLLMDKSK